MSRGKVHAVRRVSKGYGPVRYFYVVWPGASPDGKPVREFVGKAYTLAEEGALRAKARKMISQREQGGQQALFECVDEGIAREGLVVLGPESHCRVFPRALWDFLNAAYDQAGLDVIDEPVFRYLVCLRLIEPSSKAKTRVVATRQGISALHRNTISSVMHKIGTDPGFSVSLETVGAALAARFEGSGAVSELHYDATTVASFFSESNELMVRGYSKRGCQIVCVSDTKGLCCEHRFGCCR